MPLAAPVSRLQEEANKEQAGRLRSGVTDIYNLDAFSGKTLHRARDKQQAVQGLRQLSG